MFVIEVPYFNLDQIYNSGQVPRWIKLRELKYVIPFQDKVLKIEQQKNRLIMSCNEDDFYNIWYRYFDLRTDYLDLNAKVKKLGGKFKIIANRGNGIHILNQDRFEVYVFTKLVIKLGYQQAGLVLNHIAQDCGIEHKQSMREAGRITWYEFPTPMRILENFINLRPMGKVNDWLKRLCKAIVDEGLDIFENATTGSNILLKLFMLHDISVFPIIGIEETLVKNFDCEPEDFADWYLDGIESKGLVYMYILHHIMNSPKKIKEVTTYGLSR